MLYSPLGSHFWRLRGVESRFISKCEFTKNPKKNGTFFQQHGETYKIITIFAPEKGRPTTRKLN